MATPAEQQDGASVGHVSYLLAINHYRFRGSVNIFSNVFVKTARVTTSYNYYQVAILSSIISSVSH